MKYRRVMCVFLLLAASVPCTKNGRMVLAFRISGEIDLDDVTLYREEPENMPEAQKHPAGDQNSE